MSAVEVYYASELARKNRKRSYSNMTQEDASEKFCNDVFDKHSNTSAYQDCIRKAMACKDGDSACEELAEIFAEAQLQCESNDGSCLKLAKDYLAYLEKGNDIEFDKYLERIGRQDMAKKIAKDLGTKLLNWFMTKKSSDTDTKPSNNDGTPPADDSKNYTGLYIGLGVLGVGIIGTIIYFVTKR